MILKEATLENWELLLEWRNDLDTRKNSHNIDLVEATDHKKWLSTVIENPNRKLYIAYKNEIPVGTVRADYDEFSKSYELSWTVSPNARGQGVGKNMVRLFVNALDTKIRAEIKVGNISSVKIAEFAGLTYKEKKGSVLHYST